MMPILACLISFLLACGLVGLLGNSEPMARHAAPQEAKAMALQSTAKHLARHH